MEILTYTTRSSKMGEGRGGRENCIINDPIYPEVQKSGS